MQVRSPLALKVFAAVFGTAALLVVAMTVASVWRVDRGFVRYVQQLELDRLQGLVEQIQRDRAAAGDWRFIPGDPQDYQRWFHRAMGMAERPDHPPPRPGFGPPERRPPPDMLVLIRRVALFDDQGRHIAGAAPSGAQTSRLPIVVHGQTVGHVALQTMEGPLGAGMEAFLQEQWRDAVLVGAAALLLSALVSMAFARHLRRPVRQLVDGTGALAAGALSTRLPADRRDEFGLIAGHFNQMAVQLEHEESARREWLASTSHELRTPLTVLRALIEALQEGIRQGDPATLQRLHDQVMALSRLVDDLYQLAQHDAGRVRVARQTLDPRVLVEDVLDAQRQRLAGAGIAVTVDDQTADQPIAADPQRLAQLVHNLLENTLRYTDAPGRLHITLSLAGERPANRQWCATFDDSAPGVTAAALPRLFDRFYRGEGSRSRATGGSGLGLSICRAIAEEHGGHIDAQPSPLGGLRITVTLPA